MHCVVLVMCFFYSSGEARCEAQPEMCETLYFFTKVADTCNLLKTHSNLLK